MQVIIDGKVNGVDPGFAEEVRSASGQPIELCYHCQKCAAGCLPMAGFQDTTPNQLLRMINLGLKKQVLESPAIWLCTGCETCGARCPNGISIADVCDAAREIALAGDARTGDRRIPLFMKTFLSDMRSRGRVNEAFMMVRYKLLSGQYINDMDSGLKMFLKGKLALIPKGIKGKGSIKKLFSQAEEESRRKFGSRRGGQS